ncbi:hypothetical protein HPP92_004523 [Vanilla planifolia]|uniref:Uncharacterized protein n=1 Tax=Vanilla planifolia TaxID=51239 RepID=A0A835RQI2_VANPL|nr:hypothetical protein HPP92_004523 [Vanilla planifolia]
MVEDVEMSSGGDIPTTHGCIIVGKDIGENNRLNKSLAKFNSSGPSRRQPLIACIENPDSTVKVLGL